MYKYTKININLGKTHQEIGLIVNLLLTNASTGDALKKRTDELY